MLRVNMYQKIVEALSLKLKAPTMTTIVCCCGDRCNNFNFRNCGTAHRCWDCDRPMHTICGYPIPEEEQTRGFCYAQRCFDCGDKKKPTRRDANELEEEPAPKRRKKRPDATYTETAGGGATDWTFPSDKPEYKSTFIEFMNFISNKSYAKSKTFTQAELLKLTPKAVLAFLTYKAFGKTERIPEDKPSYGRSNHIKNIKMKLSYFMPSGSPWVDLPNGTGHGNPTQHKTINKLIADVVQFETRGEGAEAHDVRDMTVAEFEKELELLREHKDPLCRYRNPLIGIYQFHFITRADDVCNFKLDDPQSHPDYDFALAQSVRWSKNVRDSRNCPDQLLLASSDYKSCIFVALSTWLEYSIEHNPEATFMMTEKMPPPNATKQQHSQFIRTISKTYRNRLASVVFSNAEFKQIYKGNDKRSLGLHSKRKMGSTQAKRRGSPAEYVEHRGRWMPKKGSRIVTTVYIDPEDVYADAMVAANLCLGGPIKYKLCEAITTHIDTDWLAEHVVPHIAQHYSNDRKLIYTLGLARLCVLLDEEASESLGIDARTAKRVRDAYAAIPVANKPNQPVTKLPLHVYRVGEETFIEEVWAEEEQGTVGQQGQQQGQQGQQQGAGQQEGTRTVGDNLARVPASGGSAATQQVLQTLLIQNQQLQWQQQEMERRQEMRDQANRAWLEEKVRRINNNIRRFGGTIQGGMVRQQPRRQDELRRARAEEQQHGIQEPRGRQQWPTLCPNLTTLMSLWTEYEFGIGGRMPAKNWNAAQRGNKSQKQTYYRRNCIWKLQLLLVKKDHRIESANREIRRTYGQNTSITNTAKAIVTDRTRYKAHGGLHPNFR
jgi:hypothetical protein